MNIIDKFSPGHEITPEQRLNDWLPQLKRHYNGDTVTLLSCDIGSSNFGNHQYLIDTPDGLAVCYHDRTPLVDFDCDIYPAEWGIDLDDWDSWISLKGLPNVPSSISD